MGESAGAEQQRGFFQNFNEFIVVEWPISSRSSAPFGQVNCLEFVKILCL